MFKCFDKLLKSSDGLSIENEYSRSELRNLPVIRDEKTQKYLVFQNRKDFWDWYSSCEEKHHHEVIFGWSPQKLKFDVDVPIKKIKEINGRTGKDLNMSDYDSYMIDTIKTIIKTIHEEFYEEFSYLNEIFLTDEDIVVCESHGYDKNRYYKYSYHIIITYAVNSNKEAQNFSDRVYSKLPEEIQQYIDTGVNKRIQNFRLINSEKNNRIKKLSTIFKNVNLPCDTLITAGPEDVVLKTQNDIKETVTIQKENAYIDRNLNDILEILSEFTENHRFRECKNSTLLIFDRINPSLCKICNEIHHKDNTMMIAIRSDKTNKCVHLIEYCRHAQHKHKYLCKLLITEDNENRPENRQDNDILEQNEPKITKHVTVKRIKGMKDRLDARLEQNITNCQAVKTKFENLPEDQKNIYSENRIREYEKVETLAVKAPMKMGKTKAIRSYIDKHYPLSSIYQPVIRFVTFRQTFSKNIGERFPEFSLYNEITSKIINESKYPRLIIQTESLHRLEPPSYSNEPIDLLILDESESIIEQLNSGLYKNFGGSFAMFQWMMRTARHVICMDANLGDLTYDVLKKMRSKHPIYFHWNIYKRAKDDNEIYYTSTEKSVWINKLYIKLKKNYKIVLATNSIKEAEIIHQMITKEYPHKNIGLYSSKTAQSIKTVQFADVHKYWTSFDILIYTPTVTAGISYELKYFDYLFGYFTNLSCTVETCRQMMGRVRNIAKNKYFLCFNHVSCSLPIKKNNIRNIIYLDRYSLYSKNEGIMFEYEDNGKIKFPDSDYFHLWLSIKKHENISKNYFIERFVDQLIETGATVKKLVKKCLIDSKVISRITESHKQNKKELEDSYINAVENASDIADNEAMDIKDRIARENSNESQGDRIEVSVEERNNLDKWKLRKFYNWEGKIDYKFVKLYHKKSARQIYSNLKKIYAEDTLDKSLEYIKLTERSSHKFLTETKERLNDDLHIQSSVDYQDLHASYKYLKHYMANQLLKMLGFANGIFTKETVNIDKMHENICGNLLDIRKNYQNILQLFETRKIDISNINSNTDRKFMIKKILMLVNEVTRSFYGIRVISVNKINSLYIIKQTELGKLFRINGNKIELTC